ncbi:hypothetical protein CN918_27005 [Priestia megaterium]|nr:hypothetical protein CN918_27005 [Priestia megaterium]
MFHFTHLLKKVGYLFKKRIDKEKQRKKRIIPWGDTMEIRPEDMVVYLKDIDRFSEKFPMMRMKDINFLELAKQYNRPPMPFLSTAVFIDAMHEANRQSEKGYYIDLSEVKKIKVIRRSSDWTFHIMTKQNKTFKLKHKFE